MRHAARPGSDVSDAIVGAVLIGLAAGCLGFAGYMVLRLRAMDNPPADMGLYIPEALRRNTAGAVLVDPLITGSVDAAGESRPGRRILQPYTRDQPVLAHRLVAVLDGLAFVEVARLDRTDIVAVRVGSDLPGAGTVRHIEKFGGRWLLVTDSLEIGGGRQ